jgi:hypothetical protein
VLFVVAPGLLPGPFGTVHGLCTNILPMTTPNWSLPRGTQCEAEVQYTLRSEAALDIPTALVIA